MSGFTSEIYEKHPDADSEAYRKDSRPATSPIGMYSSSPQEEPKENVSKSNSCIMQGKTLQPIEYKVIVLPDQLEETDETLKRFKAMGMELPAAEKEREKSKQISGVLVAIGGNAFSDMANPIPKVGDKVYFAKYGGLILKADDGTDFRMMNDKDITGVLV